MFLVFILGSIGSVLGYVTRLVFTHYLSVEEFGLFFAVYSTIYIFSPLRDLGLTEALIFFVNLHLAKKQHTEIKKVITICFAVQFITAFLVSIILFLMRNYLAKNYFHTALSVPVMNFLLGAFILEIGLLTLSATFTAYNRFLLGKISDLLKAAFILIFSVLGFHYLNQNFLVPSLAHFLAIIVTSTILLCLFFRHFTFFLSSKERVFFHDFSELFSYALPILFSAGASVLITYTDTIMLTFYSGIKIVGLYNVGYLALAGVLSLCAPIQTVLFPKFSQLYHAHKINEAKNNIELIYSHLLVIFLPVIAVLIAYAPFIIQHFFGEAYLGSVPIFRIFSFFSIFAIFWVINFSIMAGLGMVKERSVYLFYAAIVNIILNYFFIKLWSGEGAALASGIAFAVLLLLTLKRIYCVLQFKINLFTQFRVLVSAFAFLGAIELLKPYFQQFFQLPIVFLIAGSVYLATLALLRVITREKITHFKRLFLNL